MQMQVQLVNPALIFVYSLALLLFGCAIGIHWSRNTGIAIWIAACAALLMVMDDLLEGMIWFEIAAR